jgi:hypothetical protein
MQRKERAELRAAKNRIRKRAKKAREKEKAEKAPLLWVWEFSKKVVITTTVLYLVSFLYALLVCYRAIILTGDASVVGTLITESNETFRVVVGGYLVKAGVENGCKIVTSNIGQKPIQEPEPEPEQPIEPQEGAGGLIAD